MYKDLFLIYFVFIFGHFANGAEKIVSLSEKTHFTVGDTFKLISTNVSVKIEFDKGSECAVPGYNCGAGYRPPHPIYKLNCDNLNPCPYIVMMVATDSNKGIISIENEDSCVKSDPKMCFYELGKSFKSDIDCLKLKTPLAQYYCLEVFQTSTLKVARTLCDTLPKDIYALQWNCFYDYAIRYRDPTFCEKYSNLKQDLSGKSRCYLKMAELFKDKKFCKNIIASKDDSYKEQCDQLKY